MALETKVILAAIAEIIAKSKTREEIYVAVKRLANVEGVVLPSLEEIENEHISSGE